MYTKVLQLWLTLGLLPWNVLGTRISPFGSACAANVMLNHHHHDDDDDDDDDDIRDLQHRVVATLHERTSTANGRVQCRNIQYTSGRTTWREAAHIDRCNVQ
jgi:hypothetical protein